MASQAEKDFSAVMATIPQHMDFEIEMPVNTQTASYDDENTNIPEGQAMLCYGASLMWYHETAGNIVAAPIAAAEAANLVCQIHRNTDNADVILPNDKEQLFLPWEFHLAYGQNAAGEVWHEQEWPKTFGERTVTFSPTLRALFKSDADVDAISTADYSLLVRLYFDYIPAPPMGTTKLGRLNDL